MKYIKFSVKLVVIASLFLFGNFAYAQKAPNIYNLSPSYSGEVGDIITIKGENFIGDSPYKPLVDFVGESLTIPPITYSNTELTFEVQPYIPLGDHEIRVTQKAGLQGINTVPFKVVSASIPLPKLNSIEPESADKGEVVTIYGEDIGDGAYVRFANEGVTVSPISQTSTTLKFVVPDGVDYGSHTIYIGLKATDLTSNSEIFKVASQIVEEEPEIDSVDPSYVEVGDIVTITGENFGDGAYVEVFGESFTSPAIYSSDTKLTFQVSSAYAVGDHIIRIRKKASDVKSNTRVITVEAPEPEPEPEIYEPQSPDPEPVVEEPAQDPVVESPTNIERDVPEEVHDDNKEPQGEDVQFMEEGGDETASSVETDNQDEKEKSEEKENKSAKGQNLWQRFVGWISSWF